MNFEQELIEAQPRLFRLAMKHCRGDRSAAEDLTQEVMLKAIRGKESFEPGSNINAWLSTIMRNEFLTKARRAGRVVEDPEGYMTAAVVAADNPAEALEAKQDMARIMALPPEKRDVLLAMGDGASYDEAAEKFGVAVGTIKSRVHRARVEMEKDPIPTAREHPPVKSSLRAIVGIQPDYPPQPIKGERPEFIDVDPRTLLVEDSYQRRLTKGSWKLIRSIIRDFDWSRFRPPVCVRVGSSYVVLDGQHTAIGAASRPEIKRIPIMVTRAETVSARADTFVSHNKNRLAMAPLQIFHASAVAGDPSARAIIDAVHAAGGKIPRSPKVKANIKPDEITPISTIQAVFKRRGSDGVKDVVSVCLKAGLCPVSPLDLISVEGVLFEPEFEVGSVLKVVAALKRLGGIDRAAAATAAKMECAKKRAAMIALYQEAAE